ncbi:hypothetical protein [Ralstonia sp. 1B3]|uniref:hypothetical protein n=1 Tax=Ralstonia sp. 1B3 TaxID=2997421 RepID=UPI002FCB5A17
MTRSISKSAESPAGDSLTEYQKGVRSAHALLRAIDTRNAAEKPRPKSTVDAPNNPDLQR